MCLLTIRHIYRRPLRLGVVAGLALLVSMSAVAQRQMEKLGRGVVAMRTGTSTVYIGWRLLATDPEGCGFNVYRVANGGAAVKLNASPLTNTTDYVDSGATLSQSNAWYVRMITNGVELVAGPAWGLAANVPTRKYFAVPLQAVTGGAYPPYDVKFCWVGDFDGDGEYDFLVDRLSTTGSVNQYLQAYLRDGTFLWQMDMGYNSTNQYNIEPGASAISVGDKDNVTVYDFDGDGRAEIVVRVARGTVLPDGTVVTGPDDTTQYLSVLDGFTGHERARATIPNPFFVDGPLSFHFGVLYCDGVHPSLALEGENRVGSGSFNEITMAWDFRDGQLTERWQWTPPAGGNYSRGHQIRIADVNHDGIDDVVEIGSVNNGATGQPLFDTELVHGDRLHITDIDPDRPGLETFVIQQNNPTLLATALYESATGKFIKKWYAGGVVDVGRGIAIDMDPGHKGYELYSTQPGIFDCKGNEIFANNIWPPEGVWWDADLSRELEDGAGSGALSPVINKFNPATGGTTRLYSIYSEGVHQAYGGRAAFWGDILGDWREELVLVANDYSEFRIYTTTTAATNRLYCLMQDPAYRCQATVKGYYEANYPDYYLGTDMQPPPPPPVSEARLVWRGGVGNAWDTGATANWFTNNLWISNTAATTFTAGDTVLFDLTGTNTTPVGLSGALTPGWVTVHSPVDYTFGGTGSLAGPMKLTKAGRGTLTLKGTNTFTGATTVWEGALVVNGSLASSAVSIRSGAWLDAALAGSGFVGGGATVYRGGSVSPGNGVNAAGTLTISNGLTEINGAFNRFDLSDDPTGILKSNDVLNVQGNLSLTGTNTIYITCLNTNLAVGVYPLISYSGNLVGGLSNLEVDGLPGVPVALTNPPGQIALVVKSYRLPATITWTGGQGGNVWDLLTTANWLNGALKDQFAPNDTVRFNDIGASNPVVTLSGELNAAGVTVDSTANYTLGGNGAIIGSASLTKSNTGTLTISAANNTFTGRTLIGGGTLVVSRLDAVGFPSALGNPGGGVTNLVFSGNSVLRVTGESYTDRGMTLSAGTNTIDVSNSVDQVTVAGQVVGTGALQKLGAGTLALNASNSYSGGTLVRGGSVSLGGGNANQYALGTGLVTLDNGTLRMYSDSGSYDKTYWSLFVPTNSTGTIYADDRCNLYGLLTGGGTLNFNVYYVRTELDGNWSGFTGLINVGTDSGGGDFRIGNTYGYANASVNLASGIYAYHISGSGVSFGALSGSASSTLSGTPWTIGAKGTDTVFAGNITGSSVTKVGTGTLTLTGTNSYTGATVASAGTLVVNGDSSAATGAVTVNSGASLGGFGVIGGATTVSGKLSPGGSPGTLTFTNDLTLNAGSTVYVEIRKSPLGQDLVDVAGALRYGGTLVVTNLAGTLAVGDSFKVFNAGSYAGGFSAFSGPTVPAGSMWDLSALTTSGTISIAISNAPAPRNLVWKGDGVANVWDISTTPNWLDTNGAATFYSNGDTVLFSDAGSNNTPIQLLGTLQPAALTVNATKDYILTGAGLIGGTGSLVKTGAGMLTLETRNAYTGGTMVTGGALRLGGLANRWSFNGNLIDSAGGRTATVVDVGTNNVTLSGTGITLAGGTQATSDYVSLGANLLPNGDTPVTIELWATQNAVRNWSRIFDFGSSTAENLLMSWSQGTTLASDRVEWKDTVTSTVDNSNQPYTLGTEFHIAMVIEPGAGANGTTRVTWYKAAAADAVLGAARGTFDSTNTLAGFSATNCWLGRSEYASDYTASATYNEVRIWRRALSAADLQTLHTAGPDTTFGQVTLGSAGNVLPAGGAVNLAVAGARLENLSGSSQTIGSLAGVAGTELRLTGGSLAAGGSGGSTTFAGVIAGTGGLTKQGAGTLTLSGASTYTGPTAVVAGSLRVSNSSGSGTGTGAVTVAAAATLEGNGSVAGPVALGGTLSPGPSVGTLTIGSALTLSPASSNVLDLGKSPLTNDLVIVGAPLSYAGSLVVACSSSNQLAAGDSFRLFSAPSYGGAFSSYTLPFLNAGLAWDSSGLAVDGSIKVVSVSPPQIAQVVQVGSNLVISGSGGTPGAEYFVLSSTNASLPLVQWTRSSTNRFDATGQFVFTNAIAGGESQQFFILELP